MKLTFFIPNYADPNTEKEIITIIGYEIHRRIMGEVSKLPKIRKIMKLLIFF